MNRLLISVLVLVLTVPVFAGATVTIKDTPTCPTCGIPTIPNGDGDTAVSKLIDNCSLLRAHLNVAPAVWEGGDGPFSNCAKEFIRIGARGFENQMSKSIRTAESHANQNQDMADYDEVFPVMPASFCGDGVVDTFDSHTEECDPPDIGNGCDFECHDE